MFGAATPFNAQALASMMGIGAQNFQLPPAVPQIPTTKMFSPEANIFSLLQEASKLQPCFPSLQDIILQHTFLNLIQAQANAKVASPPPPQPQISQFRIPVIQPSQSPPSEVSSRKRPSSSSSSKKSSVDDSDVPQPKRTKQMRKLASEDAETNSPVSGMHIKVRPSTGINFLIPRFL